MFFRQRPAPPSLIETAMRTAAQGALAVSVVDEAGTLVQLNETYARLQGDTAAELQGRPLAQVQEAEEASPAARARFWQALRAGTAFLYWNLTTSTLPSSLSSYEATRLMW